MKVLKKSKLMEFCETGLDTQHCQCHERQNRLGNCSRLKKTRDMIVEFNGWALTGAWILFFSFLFLFLLFCWSLDFKKGLLN